MIAFHRWMRSASRCSPNVMVESSNKSRDMGHLVLAGGQSDAKRHGNAKAAETVPGTPAAVAPIGSAHPTNLGSIPAGGVHSVRPLAEQEGRAAFWMMILDGGRRRVNCAKLPVVLHFQTARGGRVV